MESASASSASSSNFLRGWFRFGSISPTESSHHGVGRYGRRAFADLIDGFYHFFHIRQDGTQPLPNPIFFAMTVHAFLFGLKETMGDSVPNGFPYCSLSRNSVASC